MFHKQICAFQKIFKSMFHLHPGCPRLKFARFENFQVHVSHPLSSIIRTVSCISWYGFIGTFRGKFFQAFIQEIHSFFKQFISLFIEQEIQPIVMHILFASIFIPLVVNVVCKFLFQV